MDKYADAVRFSRLALAHSGVSPFLKYIAVNKILDASQKDLLLLSETERWDYSVQSMQMYESQDDENKKVIKEFNYPTTLRGSANLVRATLTNQTPALQERCATAAPIAAKYENSQDNALQLFSFCYTNKYAGSEAFHLSAIQLAKTMFSTATPEKRAKAQSIGDAALMTLENRASATDCEKFKQYAADYQSIGLASKGLNSTNVRPIV